MGDETEPRMTLSPTIWLGRSRVSYHKNMFGIGIEELIVILVIALIVVGPERMPELARQVGKAIRDVRRMYDNLRSELGPDYARSSAPSGRCDRSIHLASWIPMAARSWRSLPGRPDPRRKPCCIVRLSADLWHVQHQANS